MKALVYNNPETLDYQDFEYPEIPSNSSIVKIEAAGICGSDMHAYLGHDARRPAPLILGHEASGLVVEGNKKNKRVVINPLVTCMECHACLAAHQNICANRQLVSMPPRHGTFAEYVAIPDDNLIEVPDHITFNQAALCEPVACSYHAVIKINQSIIRPLPEASALVIGGGAIGLAAALVLADFGCSDIWIAETNPLRHKMLEQAGPFKVYNPIETNPEKEFDAIVDAYGGEKSRALATTAAASGSIIAHIGLAGGAEGLDTRKMTLQEITFIGCYTYSRRDFIETANALFSGRLGALDWIEERSLKNGAQAFKDLYSGNFALQKIILKP